MLKFFDTTRNILFFPKKWANSVTSWLRGISSPNKTLDINNTDNPTESRGCQMDINVERVYELLKTRIELDFIRKDGLANVLSNIIDLGFMKMIEGNLSLNLDAFGNLGGGSGEGGGEGSGEGGGEGSGEVTRRDLSNLWSQFQTDIADLENRLNNAIEDAVEDINGKLAGIFGRMSLRYDEDTHQLLFRKGYIPTSGDDDDDTGGEEEVVFEATPLSDELDEPGGEDPEPSGE